MVSHKYFLFQNGIADSRLLKRIVQKINKKNKPKNKYKTAEQAGLLGCPYICNEEV